MLTAAASIDSRVAPASSPTKCGANSTTGRSAPVVVLAPGDAHDPCDALARRPEQDAALDDAAAERRKMPLASARARDRQAPGKHRARLIRQTRRRAGQRDDRRAGRGPRRSARGRRAAGSAAARGGRPQAGQHERVGGGTAPGAPVGAEWVGIGGRLLLEFGGFRRTTRSPRMSSYLFTSESVSEGHPDKVADQISDAILDAILAQDKTSRVAAETLCKTGLVVLAGEITTRATVDYAAVARGVVKRIGYNNADYGMDYRAAGVLVELRQAVARHRAGRGRGQGPRPRAGRGRPGADVRLRVRRDAAAHAAPDPPRAPAGQRQSEVRRDGRLPWLGPDAKSQVTVRYVDGKPELDRHRRPLHPAPSRRRPQDAHRRR